jgi:hypothetical protein
MTSDRRGHPAPQSIAGDDTDRQWWAKLLGPLGFIPTASGTPPKASAGAKLQTGGRTATGAAAEGLADLQGRRINRVRRRHDELVTIEPVWIEGDRVHHAGRRDA